MSNFEQCSLAEALSAWGHHAASGRPKENLPPGLDLEDPIACISLALSSRSMLIARIIASEPVIALRGLVSASEILSLELADGRTVPEWVAATSRSGTADWRYVEAMVSAPSAPGGALVAAAQLITEEPDVVTGPKYLYDGWHRAAAWLERSRRGLEEHAPIYLILTRQQDPLRTRDS